MIALVPALLALAPHGGDPPTYNSPAIQAPCYDPSGEHDYWMGYEYLHGQYVGIGQVTDMDVLGELGAYGSDFLTNPCSGAPDARITTGELGRTVLLTLRAGVLTYPALHPDAVGYVFWSTGWVEPTWGNWGWYMSDPALIYDIWTFDGEGLGWPTLDWYGPTGNWIGWRSYYTNPTDPALAGASVYMSFAIDHHGDGNLTLGTGGRLTFTP